jgi:phosphoribosylamine---glycine ligase
VLLIGGGGREHALAWKMQQSARLGTLWLTRDGAANAGLRALPGTKICDVSMDGGNAFRMQRWCDTHDIQLVVIGPERELAAGVTDILHKPPTRYVFGPTKAAAQLEADKAFAKQLMRHAAIPTAESRTFTEFNAAMQYIESRDEPLVVKATGLAAGKGAIVCENFDESREAVQRIMVRREFGEAGSRVIIEEKLLGQEVSVLALVDGRTISLLDPCQDHKQVGEGDTGPNTGGMGAYSPTPLIDRATMALVERQIMVPIVDAMRREGIEYRGVLYAGIMLTAGGPKVLEFNCRFGDPECQPLMARLKGDLLEIMWATATGGLCELEIDFEDGYACCVVMCSGGYPGQYKTGFPITGIEDAEAVEGATVFHAGTTITPGGELVTNGGRVLGVTALAGDLQTARDLANAACERIHFSGAHYRRDIGDRVLVRA